MQTINSNGNNEIKCAECDFQAHDLGQLRSHVELIHTKKMDFKCIKCIFRGKSSVELGEHMKMEHINDKQLESDECNVKEKNSRNKRNHKRKLHSSLDLFKCQTSQKNFESEKKLNVHNEIEHVNVPEQDVEFNCTGCSFQTTERKHLKKHIELVHTLKRNFNCSRCDYIGITSAELSKHIEEIHGANDFKDNQCNPMRNLSGSLEQTKYRITIGTKQRICVHLVAKSNSPYLARSTL